MEQSASDGTVNPSFVDEGPEAQERFLLLPKVIPHSSGQRIQVC